MNHVPVSLRAAAVLVWVSAFGLGITCLIAIRSLAASHGIATVLGFPAFGRGAFERHGLPTTIPLVLGFLLICVLEAVAGGLLWSGRKVGAVISLVLLVPGAVYWWGFDLPYPPVAALMRAILIVVGWSRLN